MGSARRGLASGTGSPSNSGIVMGGNLAPSSTASSTNVTEEFSADEFQNKTVTTS